MSFLYKGQRIPISVGLPGSAGPGGDPIGTVISFMGLSAPGGYLVCDGAEHSIAEYPALAAHFREQFGATNHFGGDGTKTFAVPDMRDLFLRGFHGEAAAPLSGDIGKRQEATQHVRFFAGVNPNMALNTDGLAGPKNLDSRIDLTTKRRLWAVTSSQENADSEYTYYTSHPVNTAVLYCIKAVYNASSSVREGEVYSAEEIQIGTWFGKPLYRKCYQLTTPTIIGQTQWIGDCDVPDLDMVIDLFGMIKAPSKGSFAHVSANQRLWSPADKDTPSNLNTLWIDAGRFGMMSCYDGHCGRPVAITLEYTKATG